jgi:hypothetical protein
MRRQSDADFAARQFNRGTVTQGHIDALQKPDYVLR